MSKREKMSPIDTAWLRMDRPSNLMMIVGVTTYETPVNIDQLRQTIHDRVITRYDRFRKRVHHDSLGAWWEDDPEFDLDNHIVRRALPGSAGKAELQALASEMATEPLNPLRPMWRFDLIEDYQGGSALLSRIHHCIADGIALVGVMLSMTDLSADPAPAEQDVPAKPRKTRRVPQDPIHAVLDPVVHATQSAFGMTGKLWHSSAELVSDPDKMAEIGKHGAGFAAELGKLLVMPADSPTRFKGKTGTVKQVAWCDPIPLDEVKAFGKVLDCSINDVLLSAVAGALRTYLVNQGDDVAGVEIRAMVPVNMRAAGDLTLGNRFGMVTLALPVYEANPVARLFEVRRRMQEMKGSYQPPLTMVLLGVSGLAPKFIQEKFLDMLANKASAVMTNVPGPRQPLYQCGAKVDQIMFWVPQSGDIGMGVSILSYNGMVQFGLITDRHFVASPEEITSLFVAELDRMMMTLMIHEDWNQPLDPDEIEHSIEVELGIAPPEPKVRSRRAPASRAPSAPIRKVAESKAVRRASETSSTRKAPSPRAVGTRVAAKRPAASGAKTPGAKRTPKRTRNA